MNLILIIWFDFNPFKMSIYMIKKVYHKKVIEDSGELKVWLSSKLEFWVTFYILSVKQIFEN